VVVAAPVHEPPATVVKSHTGLLVLVTMVSHTEPTAMHNGLYELL
jgi:hypothetical protein